jgi:fumarylacetoacetate (FAA) hydrolase
MKLATLDNGTRDGALLVVNREGTHGVSAESVAPTLQAALEDWDASEPALQDLYVAVNAGEAAGAFELDLSKLLAPLPRSYQWIDGSAYLNHIELVRRARGAEMPKSFLVDPLVYQGGSDRFLGSREDIAHASTAFGIDFEAELAVITGDVPYGTTTQEAAPHIKLMMLVNDVSLRALIPAELGKSFGFFVSKPATAFSPFAITPDELGDSWVDGKVHLDMEVSYNGAWYGNPDAGPEMQFSFHQLIAHVTQTRNLGAGTIIGSGTISNKDRSRGSCCLAEKRMIEKIETGEFITPFMQYGDTVHIDMKKDGKSLFGSIDQRVIEGKTSPRV